MIDILFVFASLLLELDSILRCTSIPNNLIVLPAVIPPCLILFPTFLHPSSSSFELLLGTLERGQFV